MILRKKITKDEFIKSVTAANLHPSNNVKKRFVSNYVVIKGVPHKLKKGLYVPLTKLC